MRLGAGGEHMLAVDKHRHQHREIGRMGVAEIGIIVQEGVALGEILMQISHRLGLQVRAENMHR